MTFYFAASNTVTIGPLRPYDPSVWLSVNTTTGPPVTIWRQGGMIPRYDMWRIGHHVIHDFSFDIVEMPYRLSFPLSVISPDHLSKWAEDYITGDALYAIDQDSIMWFSHEDDLIVMKMRLGI